MEYTHVLWDFNGTILNDVDAAIRSINQMLKRRNMKMFDNIEEYYNVFCFPIIDYYKSIGLDIDGEGFDALAKEWVNEYNVFSKKSKIYDGVIEAFEYIKMKNIPQIILSATEVNMLNKQLFELEINRYFSEILGMDNIYAHSKIEAAKKWIVKAKPKKAVLIGDTTHDYDVCKEIGIDCVLVANGHQDKSKLLKCGCKVIDNVYEINSII